MIKIICSYAPTMEGLLEVYGSIFRIERCALCYLGHPYRRLLFRMVVILCCLFDWWGEGKPLPYPLPDKNNK